MNSSNQKLWTAKYFLKAQQIAQKNKKNTIVTMQFFQNQNQVILCGVRACLKLIIDSVPQINQIKVWALDDGALIKAREVVLMIEGPYWCFAFLEGQIDGILTHQTTIATNAKRMVESAGEHKIIYMNDRNNFPDQQAREGYAAYAGGVRIFTARGQTKYLDQTKIKTFGSVPHSLIQLYNGDLLASLCDYQTCFPNEPLVGLIDFNNDCLGTITKIKKLLPSLSAVRIDTSAEISDRSLTKSRPNYRGVHPLLVKKVRTFLNKLGFPNIKIIVSGGFTVTKISQFQALKVPVDFFGVGLAFNQNLISFTGDAVKNNGKLCAKFGRRYQNNPRLKLINLQQFLSNV